MTNLSMIVTFLRSLRQREEGVTALEYALLAALVAGGLVTALSGFATSLSTEFGNFSTFWS